MDNKAVELKDAKNFVNINGDYHGGNQAWFDSSKSAYKYGQPGGCGPITIANMIAYLVSQNPDEYGKIAPYAADGIDKFEYIQFIENIYFFCRPLSNPISFISKKMTTTLGIPFPFMLKNGIRKYTQKVCGINLKTKTLNNASFNKSVDFIKKALTKDYPVGMVIWGNKNLKTYEYHWMTIVGIATDKVTDKTVVTVASWGELHELYLEDLYFSPNKFRWFGLITFDLK